MEKPKKLLETLEKMTTPETQETNFTKYLEDTEDIREVRNLLRFMFENFIEVKEVEYIPVDDYINFYSQIPLSLWSQKPVFYFKDGRFDALGLIGERIHQFNIYSKTLELYFKDCIGVRITEAIDCKDGYYAEVTDPKERFLKYLEFIKINSNSDDLRRAFRKAKNIIHGRYY